MHVRASATGLLIAARSQQGGVLAVALHVHACASTRCEDYGTPVARAVDCGRLRVVMRPHDLTRLSVSRACESRLLSLLKKQVSGAPWSVPFPPRSWRAGRPSTRVPACSPCSRPSVRLPAKPTTRNTPPTWQQPFKILELAIWQLTASLVHNLLSIRRRVLRAAWRA